MTTEWKGIIEGLLFASGEEGMTKQQLAEALGVSAEKVDPILTQLTHEYANAGRGIMLMQSSDIYHLTTKPEHSPYYKRLRTDASTSRMSQAALESLAIVAYRQPVTKVDIEQLRGVNSDHAVNSLLKRSMVATAGRKEAVGRPYFFVTTKEFLAYFGLTSLNDLPDLPEDYDIAGDEQALSLFSQGNDQR